MQKICKPQHGMAPHGYGGKHLGNNIVLDTMLWMLGKHCANEKLNSKKQEKENNIKNYMVSQLQIGFSQTFKTT